VENHKLETKSTFDRDDAEFIWDEYKYRHGLIWKLIFQITTAVIAVSTIPYILTRDQEEKIGYFIIALPIIGLFLTIFSIFRINKECYVMEQLKRKHREFHKSYNITYEESSSFALHVNIYLVALIVLGVINLIVITKNSFPGI